MVLRLRALAGARPHLVILLAGLLLPLSYAPVKILPLFYVSFAVAFYLAWQARGQLRRLFTLGWVFGFGQFIVGFYWIGEAFIVEAEDFLWALPFAVTLLPAGLALFPAIAFWAFGASLRVSGIATQTPRLTGLLWLAAIFALAEYARANILTGLPWNLPVMGWASWLYLAQPVALLGTHGLGLVALVSAVLLLADKMIWRLAALALPLAALGYSGLALQTPSPNTDITLLVVQPNIDQIEKWQPEKRAAHIAKTLRLTQQGLASVSASVSASGAATGAAPSPIDVVIWPEVAIPALIDEDEAFGQAIKAILPRGSHLITGALRRDARQTKFYNSAMLWQADGRLIAHSDKHHLVPFGEYLPLRPWLEAIGLRQLAAQRGDHSIGPAHQRFRAAGLPLVAPLICYEAIFPYLSAGQPRPTWLVNLTNDGWFGRSLGPRQHLAQARLRAIEQGLPLIRSANTGVSAAFDGHGRQLASLGLGQAGSFRVTLPAALPPTPFANYGDLGFFALWGLCLMGLLRHLWLRKSAG
jgi:apolipoprotein N-acyltransferase